MGLTPNTVLIPAGTKWALSGTKFIYLDLEEKRNISARVIFKMKHIKVRMN